jgi:20S proteasome alpha/beta subunit
MTLMVALNASDGLVLAGDNRSVMGDLRGFTVVNDAHKRVFQLTRCCGIGVAGPPDVAYAILKGVESQLASQGIVFIDDVVQAMRQRLRSHYEELYSRLPIERRPNMTVIVGGYEEGEMPYIYSLDSRDDYAPVLNDIGFHALGVPIFPVDLLNRFYAREGRTENAAALAEFVISETANQDPKVGGPITIAVITPGEGYRELSPNEVAVIHRRNEEQFNQLRAYFYGGL